MVTTTRSMAVHAIPQATRFNNNSVREDQTHVLPESHLNLSEKQSQADDQEDCAADANQRGLKALGSDVTVRQKNT